MSWMRFCRSFKQRHSELCAAVWVPSQQPIPPAMVHTLLEKAQLRFASCLLSWGDAGSHWGVASLSVATHIGCKNSVKLCFLLPPRSALELLPSILLATWSQTWRRREERLSGGCEAPWWIPPDQQAHLALPSASFFAKTRAATIATLLFGTAYDSHHIATVPCEP